MPAADSVDANATTSPSSSPSRPKSVKPARTPVHTAASPGAATAEDDVTIEVPGDAPAASSAPTSESDPLSPSVRDLRKVYEATPGSRPPMPPRSYVSHSARSAGTPVSARSISPCPGGDGAATSHGVSSRAVAAALAPSVPLPSGPVLAAGSYLRHTASAARVAGASAEIVHESFPCPAEIIAEREAAIARAAGGAGTAASGAGADKETEGEAAAAAAAEGEKSDSATAEELASADA